MKTKLCRPVLVESKERTNIWAYKSRTLHYNEANFNDEDETIYYQLILISLDPYEKIEEGDTVLRMEKYSIHLSNPYENCYIDKCTDIEENHWEDLKIIATQSQISPEYIQQFIEEYNKSEVKDVEIEMTADYDTLHKGYLVDTIEPKLTNGFITIIEKEILYTEEEVKEIIDKISGEMYKKNTIYGPTTFKRLKQNPIK